MNSDKLLTLTTFLDNLDPTKFEFGDVVTSWDQEHSCGAVCCAIGWTPVVFPTEVRWCEHHEHITLVDGTETRYTKIAMRLFDLTYEEAWQLFSPLVDYRHYTPQKVANNIRKFVATGVLPTPDKPIL